MRVFGEDGCRARCCPEVNDGEEVLSLGDGRDEEEDDAGRALSSYGGSSLGDSSSSGGFD